MSQAKKDIIYFRASRPPRAELLQCMEKEQYKVKLCSHLEELLDALERRKFGAIIVDASASESESSSRAAELSTTERLFAIPLFFISAPGSKDAIQALERTFTAFVSLSGVIDQDQFLQKLSEAVSGKLSSGTRPALGVKKSKRDDIHLGLMKHLDPSRLVASYGGAIFAAASRSSFFSDSVLLPEHPEAEQLVALLASQEKVSKEVSSHLRRVAYISSALANGIGCSRDDDRVIRTSALIVNSGFEARDAELTRLDFLYEDFEQRADKVSAGIMKSAEIASEILHDPKSARLLELVAMLVRNVPIEDAPNVLLNAQCVFLSELTGRACWKNGIWSNLGAYRVIRELRSGTTIGVEEQLKIALSRIISEACCVRHDLDSDDVEPSTKSDEIEEVDRFLASEAKKEADELYAGKDTQLIELSDIRFGMRTSSPVFTRQGKLVLRAGVKFDEQIVWGLWQLVAVCPLLNPISVLK